MRGAGGGLWLAILVGCGPEPGLQPGELGNGVFYWLCTSDADPSCKKNEDAADKFPSVVALGADFMLQYQENSGRYAAPLSGSSHLVPGSPTGTFTAAVPGYASVVVYEGETLLDFLHIEVRSIDRLQMSSAGLGADGIDVGATATITTTPLCLDEPCAGSLPYEWATDRPDLLNVEQPISFDNQVTISGISPGEAQIIVTDGTNVGTMLITVLGDLPETGDTGITTDGTVTDGTTDTTTDGTVTDTTTDTTTDTGVEDTGLVSTDTGADTGVAP